MFNGTNALAQMVVEGVNCFSLSWKKTTLLFCGESEIVWF